jgi:UDP-N-acetylglucosamine acyltransferase
MEQHSTAIVSKKAEIGNNVTVGPFSIIEDDVVIGDGCVIDSHVSIKSGVRIGSNVKIAHASALGGPPQDLKYAGEKTTLHVGDNTDIREFVALNRGTVAHGETKVGKNCLLMAYSHVAHDCTVGDNVIFANNVQIGGHVEVGDWVIMGGSSIIHQFCKVGEHAMVGGGFKVSQDALPYSLMAGYPLKCYGVNVIGLRRRGFSEEAISTLKKVFHYLMSKKLTNTQALKKIDEQIEKIPEVVRVLEFIKHSGRGIVK